MSNSQLIRSEQAHEVTLSEDHARAVSARPERTVGAPVDPQSPRRARLPVTSAPAQSGWAQAGDAGLAAWSQGGDAVRKAGRMSRLGSPSVARKDFRGRLQHLREGNRQVRAKLSSFAPEIEAVEDFGLGWDEVLAWPRTSDRIRAEGLVRGLVGEGMNLLVTSSDPDVLEQYSHLLVRMLQQIPGSVIDFVAPVSSGEQDQKFDHWRAALSQRQASASVKEQVPPFPILVVKATELLDPGALQVLMGVPNADAQTPGRIVVVMPACPAVNAVRAVFGVQYLEWSIQAPSLDETN